MNYQQFIFKSYEFDAASKTLKLWYGFDSALTFCETYVFDFDFVTYNQAALDQAFQLLFLTAGASYYKAYPSDEIVVPAAQIDQSLQSYLGKTYQKGLGEFFYVNHLNPRAEVPFPVNAEALKTTEIPQVDGLLIGLGGGKDSLVSVELLRNQPKVATWSLNHREQLEPLVRQTGLPHFWVEREWDQQLSQLNKQDARNGHIPISAIFACVGVIVSILSGYRYTVVSNESSASEPNLEYEGVPINHQYSKSLEFEQDFQAVLRHVFGGGVGYFSLLRPFSELRIAELFAQFGFQKYQGVFSSCNRAFRHGEHHLFWCGECPKCAFVFLILTPFVERQKLEQIWSGKNLLLNSGLEPTYRQLLGIEGDKPLDCVGEVKEARAAMRLAQANYPELNKYSFEIPAGYDFRAWSEHSMPSEIFAILKQKLS